MKLPSLLQQLYHPLKTRLYRDGSSLYPYALRYSDGSIYKDWVSFRFQGDKSAFLSTILNQISNGKLNEIAYCQSAYLRKPSSTETQTVLQFSAPSKVEPSQIEFDRVWYLYYENISGEVRCWVCPIEQVRSGVVLHLPVQKDPTLILDSNFVFLFEKSRLLRESASFVSSS
jgi:hypothetical protein